MSLHICILQVSKNILSNKVVYKKSTNDIVEIKIAYKLLVVNKHFAVNSNLFVYGKEII